MIPTSTSNSSDDDDTFHLVSLPCDDYLLTRILESLNPRRLPHHEVDPGREPAHVIRAPTLRSSTLRPEMSSRRPPPRRPLTANRIRQYQTAAGNGSSGGVVRHQGREAVGHPGRRKLGAQDAAALAHGPTVRGIDEDDSVKGWVSALESIGNQLRPSVVVRRTVPLSPTIQPVDSPPVEPDATQGLLVPPGIVSQLSPRLVVRKIAPS